MKSNLLKKSMLTVVITLSTASVYYAQSVKDTISREADIEQVVLTGVADIAKDRKTPVAVSTIKEAQIVEKLGNQEFPEILNTTPSVYATKGGGGFGDSKLNIRGFDQKNIAVMVNGVPVNDMETGAVYWSNWAGLSDVTSAMQVQRGLGSSKLAIASVGGTVNILTRAADKKEGGTVSVGMGNNGYLKTLAAYNSGKMANGLSTSFLLSRTAGSTYADGTKFEGYNYYWALGYKKGNHDFQFTITGAPQTHNQRFSYVTLQNYIKYGSDGEPNIRYNPDWGNLKGEEYSMRVNYYHKPVLSLNWDWNISPNSKLNTVAYASFGRGAGTAPVGKSNGKDLTNFVTPQGILDIDGIVASNAASTPDKGILIRNASINSHNWYGVISSFNHKINQNINFTVGFDGRYYYGYHYQIATDLLGGSAYRDQGNKNLWVPNAQNVLVPGYNYVSNAFAPKPDWNPFGGKINNISDRIGFNNDGEALWYGGFGQLEYSNDKLSAFLQGAVSQQGFQRIDNFLVDGRSLLNGLVAGYATSATNPALIQATAANPALNTKTGFKNILGYNVKAGLNYNIDEHHNVFGNIGYYSKQPFLNAVYPNNKNYLNPNLTNEKIFGVELGYGFRSAVFNGNLNVYRTSWADRLLRKSNGNITLPDTSVYLNTYANISGITEIHQGVEFDGNARLTKYLSLTAMASIGDWYYKGQATGDVFDETNVPVPGQSSQTLYLDKVKVGSAAQSTYAAGFILEPVKDLKLDASYRYVDRLYANLNVTSFSTTAAQDAGALKLPSFGLFDLGASYKYYINAKQSFTIRGNVYNVFDKVYISESNTNIFSGLSKDQYAALNPAFTGTTLTTNYNNYVAAGTYNGVSQQNQAYFGFGRTWSASLAFNF
ncbi:TonB-dependent receptor [Kaistella jeonii]|uniref:TonB-dependent receptor n=1 Tax=Kaistella jeonii TaxID=266749 RepID=A0A0C1F9Z3_9FLAO|nr:TonB-dependent receptor [Kaistella jeonii]KIA89962.1 TonB-dependent receptor [Kaistella jeonii]